MTNFSFLKAKTEYALFAPACMEAEKIYVSAPAMCAVGCRKALELAVKWVYAADKSMKMPYKDNLQSLIHEPTFRFAVDSGTWGKMPFIIKLGNLAVHTGHSVSAADAAFSQVMRLLLCAVCLSLCSGSTIAMARTIRSAPSTRILSPPERWRWTPGKSRNRKVCWTRKMPRSRRCASKSSRCPPDTPPKRNSIRRNAPSSRRTSRNSRPAKSTSTWTSN